MALTEWIRRIQNALRIRWERAGVAIAPRIDLRREVTVTDALSHPAIWRAAHLLASDVAKIPVSVYRRGADGSREELRDHPVRRLLRESPGPGMTSYVFRRTLTLHATLVGAGYAQIIRSGGMPVQLVLLDPEATEPAPDELGHVWVSRAGREPEERRILDSDMLHICAYSWDGITRLSPLRMLAEVIGRELDLSVFTAMFFRRGYAWSGFIRAPRPLTPEEMERLRMELASRHSGARRAHEICILSGGLEFQPATPEPQKSQLVEARQLGTRELAVAFGLPPHKLGDPSRTSYASLEAENADYLQTALDAWLEVWEAELNLKLISEEEREDGVYIEHNRNALLRTQLADRVRAYAQLVGIGAMSPNEVRERENLNARPGGDAYYVPANWLPSATRSTEGTNGRGRATASSVAG